MAIKAGTQLTYSSIGNREDLSDTIYNISPVDTPFLAAVAQNKATAVSHDWQTDALAAASDNAQLEGNEFTYSNNAATTRESNTCQISSKTTSVSGTQDAVNKAGRTKEMVYQLMKRSKELKRDMETVLTGNYARVTGSETTARHMRSLEAWYATNSLRGANGADGSDTVAATDGTQRALTESLMKRGLQKAWEQGGDVDLIMAGSYNKQVISSFSGNTQKTQDMGRSGKKLETAIDIYVSDFGAHKIVANRFSRDRSLHLLDTDLFAVSMLRPMQTKDVAKTGDAQKGVVLAEYTLEVRNEAGSSIVADLTTSA